jgi:tight adherence protein B
MWPLLAPPRRPVARPSAPAGTSAGTRDVPAARLEAHGQVLAEALGGGDPVMLGRCWAGALVLAVAVAVPAPVPGALAALAALAAPVLARRVAAARRAERLEAQVPVALDQVAAALRAGTSLHSALAETAARTPGPLGPQLALVVRDAARGLPLRDAVEHWGRSQGPTVALAGAALALGAEAGGGVARAVDGVAATIRDRHLVAAEARALATQARASAVLLAVAPVLFAALVGVADPAAARFLLTTPLGVACLVLGLALDAVGLFWMARITRRGVPGSWFRQGRQQGRQQGPREGGR